MQRIQPTRRPRTTLRPTQASSTQGATPRPTRRNSRPHARVLRTLEPRIRRAKPLAPPASQPRSGTPCHPAHGPAHVLSHLLTLPTRLPAPEAERTRIRRHLQARLAGRALVVSVLPWSVQILPLHQTGDLQAEMAAMLALFQCDGWEQSGAQA